jgi:23S rRNA (cytosine1962-C5)-methyltransferase
VNGEGDRLGGLMVDVLGKSIVIQSSACWVESYKKEIIDAVENTMNIKKEKYTIIWRQAEARLKQDGYTATSASASSSKQQNDDDDKASARKEIVYENGIKYVVYPESSGQKTGFFCDQRDNRMMIGR